MKTYIVGHKNPDTDSIVSAIVLSFLEKKIGKGYIATRAGEINRETEYLLEKFGFDAPILIPKEEKMVILVDTTEPSQISENVSTDEIRAIFDHHNLGGLSTPKPISVRTKPVGSTATIIAQEFEKRNLEPSAEVAGIMIGAILSDTLKFTSPTTTEKDKKMAEYLNKFAKVDIDKLADEMFRAKSDISGINIADIVAGDYKVYDMKGEKVGIGVSETVLPDSILEKKSEVLEALREKKETDKLDLIFYAVVNIIEHYAVLFVLREEEKKIIEKAFQKEVKENLVNLPGVVSRKKQLVPKITEAL